MRHSVSDIRDSQAVVDSLESWVRVPLTANVLLFKVNNYLDFEYGVTCDVTLVIYEPSQFLHSGKS